MTTETKQANEAVSETALDGELTPTQEKVLAALLTSRTIEGAAKSAGIGEATLLRWLKKPEFATAYREARREVVTHSIMTLQKATAEAVETLRSVTTDTEAPAAARVSSAKVILDMSLKAVELEDLMARVEALEALTEGAKR